VGERRLGGVAEWCRFFASPPTIGRDVVIHGAKIEWSTLVDGAGMKHLGDRVESSMVGCDARIFRDFALPRAIRVHVGDGVLIAVS
jgi:hypothetical protein